MTHFDIGGVRLLVFLCVRVRDVKKPVLFFFG